MSEFIVWDNETKEFIKDFSVDNNDFSCFTYDNYGRCDYFDNFSIHQSVGKKDISNKKIYAECSIVEFDLKQNHPLEIYSKECGVFKYSNETLSYYIELLNGNSIGFGRWERVKGIKIIDTIQENKLNLIK